MRESCEDKSRKRRERKKKSKVKSIFKTISGIRNMTWLPLNKSLLLLRLTKT